MSDDLSCSFRVCIDNVHAIYAGKVFQLTFEIPMGINYVFMVQT